MTIQIRKLLVAKTTSPSKQKRVNKILIWLIISTFVFCFLVYLLHVRLFNSTPPFHKISNNFDDIYVSQAARQLPLNTSIFVWVCTAPIYHKTRVPAVNATWLHRFAHAEFFTSQPLDDERIPFRTVFRGLDDSYESLFHKSKLAFYYAYKGISDKFDFYVKADDDTFLIAENLSKFLKTLDPNKPIYAGFRLKPYLENGYNSGSVYALSRAAVKIFVDSLYNDTQKCPFDKYEDLGMGRCLANANIYPIPTRDHEDRGRFHLLDPFHTYAGNTRERYQFYYKDGYKTGFDEFSPETIAVHHMSPQEMITAELFLYRVKIN